MTRFIVCYDITDDKRRQRVAQILDSYGDRIQGSVFELPLSERLMQECLDAISDVLDIAIDGLIVYPLCANCDSKARYLGTSSKTQRIGKEDVFII